MNRKNCVSGIFWTLFFLFFLYLDVQMGENASYWPDHLRNLALPSHFCQRWYQE